MLTKTTTDAMSARIRAGPKNRSSLFAERQPDGDCMKRGFGDSSKAGYRMVAKDHTGCPCCMCIDSLRHGDNGLA